MNDLEDKVIVITGSSSGIGRAVAMECARKGAKLFLHHLGTDETERDMQTLLTDLRSLSSNSPVVFGGDLTEDRVPGDLIQKAVSSFARLDVLVNNAGICVAMAAQAVSRELLQRHLDVNFTAAYLLTQAASEQMILQGQGGSIVTVSSNSAVLGMSHLTHYGSSKAALLGMTTSFAVELGKHNIRYNCVLPGPTMTAILEKFAVDDERKKSLANKMPLGRVGRPEDVAHAVVFFASDSAAYITGQHLLVDGGNSISFG
ncbi:short-chain dehydrogenase/reductase SDR [Penicillium lividum]|nr:short-chain dehydrogenase/reductase SDR [Penicillium lividum]